MEKNHQISTDSAQKGKRVDLEDKQLSYIKYSAIGIVIAATILLGLYFFEFGAKGLSDDNGHWGTFGDYFGGVINPIVGILTVFLVLQSVRIQRKELQSSLAELTKSNDALRIQNTSVALQNFEQTFFSWLELYRAQIASLQLENTQSGELSERTGLQALMKWHDNNLNEKTLRLMQQHLLLDAGHSSDVYHERFYENAPIDLHSSIFNQIISQWENLYSKAVFQLDGSFRTLYRLIDWIDRYDSNVLTPEKKWFYVGIVRAQLSWIEMVFQYFNGITQRGEKFRALSNKYALFDNLDVELVPAMKFIRFCKIYEDRAFRSEDAKKDPFFAKSENQEVEKA